MNETSLQGRVRHFFDDFNVVFATFSGARIAERYVVPYLAIRSDGSSEVFSSQEAIGDYFQRIVRSYYARGCRICKYKNLAVTSLGDAAALGTVTWELCGADHTVLSTWTESYNLVLVQGQFKAAVSVDHASHKQAPSSADAA